MALTYADPSDLYAYGLQRGGVQNAGRLAASVNITSNTITLDVHGFALNDLVRFRADAGGSLPSPLVAGTDYYAIPAGESVFSVAATAGGAAIDLVTSGSRILVIAPLPIDSALKWASRLIDDMLAGHPVPLEAPIPEIVRMTCAELAAGKLQSLRGAASQSLAAMSDAAQKRLLRWASGVPVRGEGAQEPAQLSASAGVPYSDARGWNRFGGL
jgi:hypothetical protein